MTIGVVIPCHRQERFLPRTLAALDRALEGRAWRGVLVIASPGGDALPPLGPEWSVVAPPVSRPLTPGAARMLGFSACGGEWVLFVDADVEVDAGWMADAVALAEREPSLAGVWGRLEEWFVDGPRVRRGAPDLYRVGPDERAVDYLATLAFYRREALLHAGGYDPRLSSEEDYELGLRLRQLGLSMRSIGRLAGRHWSAPRPSFGELGRRWSTGLCFGQGQVLRLYLGRPGLTELLRRQTLNLATLGLWALGLAAIAATAVSGRVVPLASWAGLVLLVLAVMTARKRSPKLAVHALLSWTINAFGLAVGFLRGPRFERVPPREASC